MQNTMGQDLINKSLNKIGFGSRNANIRNLINDSYYFGYKWKDRLNNLTNYTHYRPMYKLIISENSYVLEKITTYVVIQHFKIVNIDVYICNRIPNELKLTSDYQDNIGIVEQYMLDEANKHNISKYKFKILENENIFSVMDSSYNIIKHDGILESSNGDGYNKSSVSISSLLENFIVPSS
jgi:hypothetical protein